MFQRDASGYDIWTALQLTARNKKAWRWARVDLISFDSAAQNAIDNYTKTENLHKFLFKSSVYIVSQKMTKPQIHHKKRC
jgi:hypothetical protein